jgi:hypothetical protein
MMHNVKLDTNFNNINFYKYLYGLIIKIYINVIIRMMHNVKLDTNFNNINFYKYLYGLII